MHACNSPRLPTDLPRSLLQSVDATASPTFHFLFLQVNFITITMQKTYTSKSEISINVRVGGRMRHIAFVPHTLGGSSLTIDDPALQEAIERHRFFGTRITAAPVEQAPATTTVETETENVPAPLTFGTLTEVKDYIAERWGVSRTVLRTRAQIETVAAEHGMSFQIV